MLTGIFPTREQGSGGPVPGWDPGTKSFSEDLLRLLGCDLYRGCRCALC